MMSPEVAQQTIYVCVPQRLGIFVSALIQTLISATYILDYKLFVHLYRQFVGGYGVGGRTFVLIGQLSGLFGGVMGVAGTWYGKRDYILSWYGWLYAQLFCYAFMYFFDVPLLLACENFESDLASSVDKYGYNQLMYQMALQGQCDSGRWNFYIKSGLAVLLIMYLISRTSRYLEYTGRLPKHLLRLPKDPTSGAFYSHSLGERSMLNGLWGKYDHHRVAENPVGGDPVLV
eukprot:CAMPEP_0197652778 /NCGR_PEP_ID=MMETSP1338-20131121/34657_1 /TAXON_ID=43686 ORGANISM="Pelagodinium beii, Strain RCC1491" /NCGR_SAMPLE_ID=MMETSP1338 /ASSEMBLY_ACC=CAM_ASM_000754 /LENGTH=230 /DNA_ID=CAMNT_0043227721 /DNA_START=102 /DNA_END=794 /DNA_ORIENTATION=+